MNPIFSGINKQVKVLLLFVLYSVRNEFLYKLNVQADELAFPLNEINGINEANKEGIFFCFQILHSTLR